MNAETKTSWDARQAGQRLGVDDWRVRDLVRQGILPHYRLGRQVRFDPDAIEEFIRTGGKPLAGPGGWRK